MLPHGVWCVVIPASVRSVLSISGSIFNVDRLVFADRFSCPLSLFFRTFNLVGHCPDRFWVMAEGRKPEFAVKPDVISCCSGVFLPQPLTLITRAS